MRESRTSGSGRGDQGNPVPYRHRDLAVGRGTGEGPLTTEPQTVRAGTENGWNPFGTVLAPALKLDVDLDCHWPRGQRRDLASATWAGPAPMSPFISSLTSRPMAISVLHLTFRAGDSSELQPFSSPLGFDGGVLLGAAAPTSDRVYLVPARTNRLSHPTTGRERGWPSGVPTDTLFPALASACVLARVLLGHGSIFLLLVWVVTHHL